MANNVEVIMTAHDASVVRAWQNYKNNVAAVEAQMGKLTWAQQRSANAASQHDSALTGLAQRVTGISSVVDIMTKALELARREWDNLIERQQKALDANKSYATSLETLAFNTAGDPKYDTLAKVEAKVNEISKAAGVSVKDVSRAVSNAASAKGQLSMDDAFDTVKDVMRFAPNSPQLQDVLSVSSLDARKMYPKANSQDAIGFTAMLGQQARITDPAKVAENALPAALLMNKIDKQGSLRESGAIYAAITQATGDETGRTSRTGGISLAIHLEKALPEFETTMKRIEFLQDNPDAAKQFLEGGGKFKGKGMTLHLEGPDGEDISFGTDKASFEKKVFPAIRELLTKGSTTDIGLRSALQALPELTEGRGIYARQVAGLHASPTLQVAARDRSLEAAVERTRISDTSGAEGAAVRKGFASMTQAEGLGWVEQTSAWWGKNAREHLLGQSPTEAAINTARANAATSRSLEQSHLEADPQGLFKHGQHEERAKKFDKIAADLEDAETIAKGGSPSIEHLNARGKRAHQQLTEARQAGESSEVIEQLKQVVEALHEQIEIEKGRRPASTTIVMPGGASPAKPVAAASITSGRPQ